MAILRPFKALRPRPEYANRVACVPYDVISTEEARMLAAGNDKSFLHIVRPEIDLPEDIYEYDDRVYQTGADNLVEYAKSDLSLLDDVPGLYVYRVQMKEHVQVGIYGCVSVEDYDNDVILKHEKTRADKEKDRTRHIITQQAHAEPVMLTFRITDAIQQHIQAAMAEPPVYGFQSDDDIVHTVWRIASTDELVRAFASVPNIYVADGHHRCKSASLAYHHFKQAPEGVHLEETAFFPAVLFPMDELSIMAYNRIVYSVPGGSEAFMQALKDTLGLEVSEADTPAEAGSVCLYNKGAWYQVRLPETKRATVADRLDVARLSEFILEPILGITDVRTDKNINFVGGIRGTAELKKLVDTGVAELAFSMYPTRIEELVDVSDAGLLMPPKSTWFEPKLRSGLLVHTFGTVFD